MSMSGRGSRSAVVVAFVALTARAATVSAEECVLQVVSEGRLDLIVAGQQLARDLPANEVHTFEAELSDGDVLAVRWRPRPGHDRSRAFLLVAQTGDGSRALGTGEGWYCSHNETRRWIETASVGGHPWRIARPVTEGDVATLAETVPFARAVTSLSSPAYLKALAKWQDAPAGWAPVDLRSLWETSPALTRNLYFSPAALPAGRIRVDYRGQSLPVEKLNRAQLVEARDYLETALWSPDVVGSADQEAEIRKQLRGIRQALGPNTDRRRAMTWGAVCILATNVDVVWEDKAGRRHRFRSAIPDPSHWKQCIDREMRRLSDIVFRKSWGRINIVGQTFVSTASLTELRDGGQGYWFSDSGLSPAVDQVSPNWPVQSLFVWIPSEGWGECPPWLGSAHVTRPTNRTRGAVLTVCYTTRERLERDGGWASPDGGGLLHEYWHNVQRAMTHVLGYKGFVPSNHNADHFAMLKAEIREQGLPEPQVQYDELLGSWPTWQMCRELAQHY
jgi:hypothetical protein